MMADLFGFPIVESKEPGKLTKVMALPVFTGDKFESVECGSYYSAEYVEYLENLVEMLMEFNKGCS